MREGVGESERGGGEGRRVRRKKALSHNPSLDKLHAIMGELEKVAEMMY